MDKKDDAIYDELLKYNFPEDLVSECCKIWKDMNARMKSKRKNKKLLFFLVFTAYCNLGSPKPPEVIGKVLEISKKDYKKAYGTYSPFDTGLPVNTTTFYPEHYIEEYCKEAQICEKMKRGMIKFSREIIKKYPYLMESSPATLSSGIFKYYTYSFGLIFSSDEIKDITGISKGTSDSFYKKIMELANS